MAHSMKLFSHSEDVPKVMSLQLLEEITNNFSEEQKLGSGTYGEVFKGVQNGEEIAVKRLNLVLGVDDFEQFKKEFENLWRLRHHNIVRLLGYCYETKREYVKLVAEERHAFAEHIFRALCFEYMHKGSLKNYLHDESDGLDWQTRYKIIKGTCQGLKYLHEGRESPIYHLDLKPDNILLDKNMVPKLADFGLSKLVHSDQTQATNSAIGTRGYLPPEYIEENLVSKKFDIFSLGVVLIMVIAGKDGYRKKAEMSEEFIDLVHSNWRKRLHAAPGCSSLENKSHQVRRCIEIALACVKADRKQRPDIGAIVHWLDETEQTFEPLIISSPRKMGHNTMLHTDTHFKNKYTEVNSSGPATSESQGFEYNFKFYMHQTIDGPGHNQVNIADPMQPLMFGCTNVHDYPIYDCLGPGAKIVARAQGLHAETNMSCDDWFHWSSITFTNERFQGSSFKAIGNQGKVRGQWAVVGGTGVFTFARGTISIRRIQHNGSSNVKEISIHSFCRTPEKSVTDTMAMHFYDRFKMVDSKKSSNVLGPSLSNPQSSPVIPQSLGAEYNLKYYMHQTIDGHNHNQVNIADPKQHMMFGHTNVHDYPIYDCLGPTAKIVARAQGLHTETNMNSDDWFHWSSIVFTNERFRGSSLMAIGNQDKLQGEWAIIGGTGGFSFAQGNVSLYRIQQNGASSNIKEINICISCRTLLTVPTEIKHVKDGSINTLSAAIPDACNHSTGNLHSGLATQLLQAVDYNLTFYMHQSIEGPNHNQINIADPKQPMMFGYTNVHDYPIYDSLGPGAKIVARAQGLHTETSMNHDDWFHWSSIVFCDERFQGSCFIAIGNQDKLQGEWAIVGGTGVFTFAQGTISIYRVQDNGPSNIKEIHISVFCHSP